MGVTSIGGALVRRRLRGRSSAMMMGGWLLVSMAMVVGLGIWAVVTPADRRGDQHTSDRDRARLLVAGCAAGESGQVHRRRLTVLGDDEHRELGARR